MNESNRTKRTNPDEHTRSAERSDAQIPPRADRMPTSDEEQRADALDLDPEVAEHYEEMAERGANQQGEGRLP